MRIRRDGNTLIVAMAAATFSLLLAPAAARAQPAATRLADLLPQLLLREITLAPPPSGLSHLAHFSPFLSGELTNPAVALERYSTALESLDADAVKKVQPSIPVENLAKAFRDMRELEVDIDSVRVLSMDATSARVSCRVTQTITPRVGSRQTTAVTRVMRLRRESSAWVIDGSNGEWGKLRVPLRPTGDTNQRRDGSSLMIMAKIET